MLLAGSKCGISAERTKRRRMLVKHLQELTQPSLEATQVTHLNLFALIITSKMLLRDLHHSIIMSTTEVKGAVGMSIVQHGIIF